MACWCFQIAGSRPSLGYMEQRNPQSSTLCIFRSQGAYMTVYLLLSTFQSFLMLFYVKTQGFQFHLAVGRKYVHYISLETRTIPKYILFVAVLGLDLGHKGSLLQRGLSLVAASRAIHWLWYTGFSLSWLLLLRRHHVPLN